jgi:hypothetical protein
MCEEDLFETFECSIWTFYVFFIWKL